ncbi:MAG: SH3 domain-containing protein [Bryobacteraceae bacterium]
MAYPSARRWALAFFFVVSASAQTRRLLPVDEASRDLKLVAYLAKFKEAVAHRNPEELLPLIASEIKLGFGGDDGIANFHPDWPALERLLSRGGAWQGPAYSVPYVFARFPDDLDAFDYAAITGKGVWLREQATSTSRGIRTMDYEIVKVEDQGDDWWKVTTLRGEKGFVSARFIASPIGYRAIFQKNRRNEWKLSALLAGD